MPIRYVNRIRAEIPFFVGLVTLCAFLFRGDVWLTNLDDPFVAGVLFTWLFVAILWGSFGVVHHADALAKSLGEPYGTLILTLSVTGIEVALISAIMLSGEAASASRSGAMGSKGGSMIGPARIRKLLAAASIAHTLLRDFASRPAP